MNIRKTFECKKRLSRFENKKSSAYRAIILLNKYYRSAAWSFKFRIIFLSKYICDVWKDLSAKSKLSADETSLFLVAHGRNNSTSHLYEDLKKINNWAAQWKIFFNLDTIKAQKDIFSRKIEMPFQPQLRFDNTYVN